MESTAYLKTLYPKLASGTLTAAELDWLLAYFETGDPEALYALVRAELSLSDETGTASPTEADTLQRVYGQVEQAITPAPVVRRLRSSGWRARVARALPYAAAVAVLALAIGTWLAVSYQQSAVRLAETDILPGGNRASLTLADGRVINLDEAQTGIIIGAEDITYSDGSALNVISSEAVGRRDISLLELTTPKGGTYQVTLPDGSKVWLNSASTLKYPSRFTGDSREVILEGEAYFDIVSMDRARITDARERSGSGTRSGGTEGTRDTRAPASNFNSDGARYDSDGARVSRVPFKVQTSTQTVEVLGTQFNISAYTDEEETKTTLVEGKVRVAGLVGAQDIARNKSGVQLSPGQQATTRGAQLEISQVDTDQYTSWKSGLFDFTGMTLPEVMRQLERWYDIEVVWEGPVPETRYLGQIYRNNNLSQVLKILESAQVRFSIQEGRKLIIH